MPVLHTRTGPALVVPLPSWAAGTADASSSSSGCGVASALGPAPAPPASAQPPAFTTQKMHGALAGINRLPAYHVLGLPADQGFGGRSADSSGACSGCAAATNVINEEPLPAPPRGSCELCLGALSLLTSRQRLEAQHSEFAAVLAADHEVDAPTRAAMAADNLNKNRYYDVVPFDTNRVWLPPLPEGRAGAGGGGAAALAGMVPAPPTLAALTGPLATSQHGNYVNASYVRDPHGWSHTCSYVAAQAPMASTVPDFWRMLHASNASAVVMLNGVEGGVGAGGEGEGAGAGACTLGVRQPSSSCSAHYFPLAAREVLEVPGVARVRCVHVSSLAEGVDFRQLEVQYAWGDMRYINHYYMHNWPDHGVPGSTIAVRRISRALDDCRRQGCHIVVHCSAGIGRTGTFIAIDLLLQRLDALRYEHAASAARGEDKDDARMQSALDVSALVRGLRQQRRGMVQTSAQYGFIFKVVSEELLAVMTEAAELSQVEPSSGAGGNAPLALPLVMPSAALLAGGSAPGGTS